MQPLLIAALALKLVIPAFDLDGAPGVLAMRVPDFLAADIAAEQCGAATPAGQLGTQTTQAIEGCEDGYRCLAGVGQLLAADFVVSGTIRRLDRDYSFDVSLIDVRQQNIRQRFWWHYEGGLKGIEGFLRTQAPALCLAMNPHWIDPAKKKAEQELAALSFDTGLSSPAPHPPTPRIASAQPVRPKPTPMVQRPSPRRVPPPIAAKPAAVVVAPPPESRPAPAPRKLVLRAPESNHPSATRPAPRFLSALSGPRSPSARRWAYTTLAVSGAAALTAGGFGLGAWSAYSDRTAARTNAAYDSAQANMNTRGTVANVAFAVAGAALVTTVVLWLAGDSMFHPALAESTASR